MGLRAPEPTPAEPDAEHTIIGHWEDSRWLRVIRRDGEFVTETSDPVQADEIASLYGGRVQRRRDFIPAECQWVDQ